MALPKLNLRDLFWLMVVVAMGLGWYAHHRQTMRTILRSSPMLYEKMTGEEVQTNRLKVHLRDKSF